MRTAFILLAASFYDALGFAIDPWAGPVFMVAGALCFAQDIDQIGWWPWGRK